MHSNGSDNGWLEPVLRDGLKRVAAPPELWDRVVLPRIESAPEPRHRVVWMLAVASAMTASILAIVWGYTPVQAGTMNQIQRAEFKSGEVSDVRSWIRNRTGVDIPLLADPKPRIEVRSANITKEGRIEVRYRAGDQDALLFVSPSREAIDQHRHTMTEAVLENATTVSWSSGQLVYTLAVERAGGMRAACGACHAELTL